MVDYWAKWTEKYPIRSIEDGLAENDWDGWKLLTDRVGKKIQLVGDDLFVTNVKFLEKGIQTGTANSILVKVNQIGTPQRDVRRGEPGDPQRLHAPCCRTARGETEDATIADIAVATNCGQIKTGAPRGSRPRRQVQPAHPDRRTARRPGRVRRQVLEQMRRL